LIRVKVLKGGAEAEGYKEGRGPPGGGKEYIFIYNTYQAPTKLGRV